MTQTVESIGFGIRQLDMRAFTDAIIYNTSWYSLNERSYLSRLGLLKH